MKIVFLTLFSEIIEQYFSTSIMGRAKSKNRIRVEVRNLRDWAHDSRGSVDDRPYGGGPGMILRVDVVHPAISDLRDENPGSVVLLTTPQGKQYDQAIAQDLAKRDSMIIIAGHYEGYDERIREYVDTELSIGDYILTGGELPGLVIADSVIRLLPGVLGDDESTIIESFSSGQLEYPQYTRPDEYNGKSVPNVLLSGNHGEIDRWRQEESSKRTKERRPDLEK